MACCPPASEFSFQSTGFFENARHFTVAGGNFSNVYNVYRHRDETGLNILRQCIVPGATFDSAERFPPGRCHPGTREKTIKVIYDWAVENANTSAQTQNSVLWLYGPAGSGKSAIAQTTAEILRRCRPEIYGGSFFLARGNSERGHANKLFTTLAHQLAVHFPSLRPLINDALVNDPTLPTKSNDLQLRSLIVEPLQIYANSTPFPSPVIIIDGLDECAGSDVQCTLLESISRTVTEQQTPLRFLIASRPEYWIRNSFETEPLYSVTKRVSLRDFLDADADIEKYLVEGFARIYHENRQIMTSVPTPWPHPRMINRFVEESSGQFIYASTVLKFVGKSSSEYCHPCRQLDIITTPQSSDHAAAFNDLDKLYATILAAYPRQGTLKQVLGGLLADASPKAIEIFLGVDEAEIKFVLNALSSLIEVSQPCHAPEIQMLERACGYLLIEPEITFYHLSFREFLEDVDRSGHFSVSSARSHDELLMAMFRTIRTSLESNYNVEPRKKHSISNSAYYHLTRKMAQNPSYTEEIPGMEDLFTSINLSLRQFLARNPFCNIPRVSYLIQDMDWIEFIFNFYESDHIHRHSSLQVSISELRADVALTKNRAVEALIASDGLCITATLIYLHYKPFISMTLQELASMPGNTESSVLSDLSNCRDIIGFAYNKTTKTLMLSSICTFSFPGILFDRYTVERRVNGWKDIQTWLSVECFLSLAEDARKFGLNAAHPRLLPQTHVEFQSSLLREFFSRSELSDITSAKYFRNECHIAMINITLSSLTWRVLSKGQQGLKWLISGAAITWINRQLNNPLSRKLMSDYDQNLASRMVVSSREIFDQCFLPTYTHPYFSNLWIYNKVDETLVNLCPRHQGSIQNTATHEDQFTFGEHFGEFRDAISGGVADLLRFHEEILGDSENTNTTERVPRIDHEAWYPHLAAFLLNVLVKHHYALLHPDFEDHHDLLDRAMLVRCLTFAQPTQSNLAAMRALAYLSHKLQTPWCPPIGFSSAASTLLKKYPSSSLSLAESSQFSAWLNRLSKREVPTYRRSSESHLLTGISTTLSQPEH